MSHHLSGAFSIEVELDRLTEAIAQRCAVIVVGMLRAAPAGAETYERTLPDAGSGRRAGARFGGVVTDRGDLEHDDGPTG